MAMRKIVWGACLGTLWPSLWSPDERAVNGFQLHASRKTKSNHFTPQSTFTLLASPSPSPTAQVDLLPSGRVKDPDDWLRLCSNSLEQLTGKTVLEHMDGVVTKLDQVHDHERFAFLSHGTQDDPIYCYFNKAALDMFGYTEDEIYRLPSRYSAPSSARSERQEIVKGTEQDLGVFLIPKAIRQVKTGELFNIQNILLWNVYNDDGDRVGQAAIYDKSNVVMVEQDTNDR